MFFPCRSLVLIDDDSVNYKRVPIVSRWTDRSLKLEKTYKIEDNRSKKSQKNGSSLRMTLLKSYLMRFETDCFPKIKVEILPNNLDFGPSVKINQRH